MPERTKSRQVSTCFGASAALYNDRIIPRAPARRRLQPLYIVRTNNCNPHRMIEALARVWSELNRDDFLFGEGLPVDMNHANGHTRGVRKQVASLDRRNLGVVKTREMLGLLLKILPLTLPHDSNYGTGA